MFARSKKQNDDTTQIPKDVADLIDEIDEVAAPFDESEMKEDEDALLVDGTDASLFDSNAVWASPPQEKHIHSPDLSGLSDISASLDDLASRKKLIIMTIQSPRVKIPQWLTLLKSLTLSISKLLVKTILKPFLLTITRSTTRNLPPPMSRRHRQLKRVPC
jgi:hypothetical protein